MEALLSKLIELEISLEVSGLELNIYDPSNNLTPELIRSIKSKKGELLSLLNGAGGTEVTILIPSVPVQDFYPLSYAQNRLYFLYRYNQDNLAYNMPRIMELEGKLDVKKINETFQKLISRHESLRTYFEMQGEGPIQKVKEDVSFCLRYTTAEASNTEELIRNFVVPFDLSTAPLMRAELLNIGEDKHLLCLDMHHIIADGVSQQLFVKDFMALYNDEILPSTPLQFKDYAVWQQSNNRHAEIQRQRAFWIEEFSGELLPLDLPLDFPRPPVMDYIGETQEFRIDTGEATQLKAIARASGTTLFMILLAAYHVLLSRLSNQQDIVIGVPTAGRKYTGLENIIGMFVNTLPVRNLVTADLTFKELVEAVSIKTIACIDNQDYPYEELVDSLKLERDASRNPLFNVLFDFLNFDQSEITIPNLTIRPQTNNHGFSKFDLTLYAFQDGTDIVLHFEYAKSLFKDETITRFIGYFKRILSIVATQPDIKIAAIEMLPKREQKQQLIDFNNTKINYPADATIISLFEKQVQQTPDKVALVYENQRYSFNELNQQANRLAHSLRDKYGVVTGDIVGIAANRSPLMIAGMLGILKAGAAYVPIDPAYPQLRKEYILKDSAVRVLLTDDVVQVPVGFSEPVLLLNNWEKGIKSNPLPAAAASNICYLIYTSGSTGNPKGVVISHNNVVNFFTGMNQRIPVNENDCMLALTSTSFDISVLEIFWTLCQGVKVIVHPSHIAVNDLTSYVPAETSVTDFSLLFFSSYSNKDSDKYGMLLDAVKYADKNGFKAVWTPERHFHEFGGLYPNPSVISAALAMVTDRITLRSGSIVSPLHDAIRIAEEWSVVDNLSKGRVELSFASGWNPNDFVLDTAVYTNRHQRMYEQVDEVKKLWRGEAINRLNGLGKTVDILVFPKPVQSDLSIWITSSGNEETFRKAGSKGANVLTHFLGQDIDTLSHNISVYRAARQQHGHKGPGKVALMLHTYVGEDIDSIEALVKEPFIEYLKSAIGLSKILHEEEGVTEADLSEERKSIILNNAFLRYYKTGSLIGTKETCAETVRTLKKAGVNEIACLVDFGLDKDEVMKGLVHLKSVKEVFDGQNRINNQVTLLQSTPSFMQQAMESSGSVEFLGSLRLLLLGGEGVPLGLVRRLQQHTNASLFNMYGPTETTIWSCVHAFEDDLQKVLVGTPIANTQLYILNKDLQLLPIGVVGDLYIAGDGLSRGYWNKPELTSEKFIANPYRPGSLMYKTSDLARWLPDGTVELLGREDYQVKIRGYRIELGEIENTLRSFNGVNDAVVTTREENGTRILVAYYTSDQMIDTAMLRKYHLLKLPEYMMPTYFVALETLPLTPNGKIDRNALPDPVVEREFDSMPLVGEVEHKLAALWADVLKIELKMIGASSDFFKLGGHSLNAMILLGRIEQAFNKSVPLKQLYHISTLREVADYLNSTNYKHKEIGVYRIPVAPNQEIYPLSSQQKRVYFLNQLNPLSLAYNETGIYHLEGTVDRERLLKAFKQLMQQHAILRTSFVIEDGEPYQKIENDVDFTIELLEAEHNVNEMLTRLVRPFDLTVAPLIRVALVTLEPDKHLLLVDMHHIITDGISKNLLLSDFISLYKQEKPVQPLLQYKDYAVWQQSAAYSDLVNQQKSFWLRLFADPAPVLSLPTDFQRPHMRTYVGKTLAFTLSSEDSKHLKQIALEERTTLYMVLLAMYNILLAKLGNQEDVVIGTPTAGRTNIESEGMIGMFVNTLALRNHVAATLSFTQFLTILSKRTIECLDNQLYPYEDLVNELRLPRDTSRNPLFDTFFVFHNFETTSFDIPDLSLKQSESIYHVSKFDLTLEVFEENGCVSLNFEYSAELFQEETIKRWRDALLMIINSVIRDRYTLINEITLLSEGDSKLIKEVFNDTAASYPKEDTLVSIFEKQVLQTPDAIAIQFGEKVFSYRELNDISGKIAVYLKQFAALDKGDLAGVLLEREEKLIPALFGILKVGAAYVPIDTNAPVERITTIIKDAKIKVLITRGRHLNDFLPNCLVIDLDEVSDVIEECSTTSDISKPQPGDLAYVIYTSGSTGVPKGVMIEHRSVINRINWMQKMYPISSSDTILQKTPLFFDVSVWELFWWSFVGASLCLLPTGGEKDPDEIILSIKRNKVTVIHFVPSMLSAFLTAIKSHPLLYQLAHLRLVFSSGETLRVEQVQQFNRLLDALYQTRLINLYGPTEATVDVSYYECLPGRKYDNIPIGKPIDNIRLYIVDTSNRLVPLGVPGELCIAGVGLAKGYLNNEDLTREKFIEKPNPLDERFYKTGDLAKWLPDGNIVYLGRIDSQVKIRGFRIELGEIETWLGSYKTISDAIVTVKESDDEKQLIAYYTATEIVNTADIKKYLLDKLPEYCLPAHYIQLDKVPVTPNGKLDVRALPGPVLDTKGSYVAPVGEIQCELSDIWGAVLKIEATGISAQTSFFELGGHSLNGINLINKIKQSFKISISLRDLFTHVTIEQQALLISQSSHNISNHINKVGQQPYYIASSAQERLFYENMLHDQKVTSNVVVTYAVKGNLDVAKLQRVLVELIKRHGSLRTGFSFQGDQVVQQVHEIVPFYLHDFSSKLYRSLEDAIKDFVRPFDLEKPPLFRCGLLNQDGLGSYFLLDIHHIICDGISLNILMNDFKRLYQDIPLDPLSLRYIDYSVWQREQTANHIIQESFWKKQFAGEWPAINLPVLKDRELATVYEADQQVLYINCNQFIEIKNSAMAAGVSGFMYLLTIYYILIARISGKTDIVIGTDTEGRSQVGLEHLVGTFVNVLPLKMQVNLDYTFAQTLQTVRESLLEAIDHQDYQFDQMLDLWGIQHSGRLIEVYFSYSNFFDQDIKLQDLEFLPVSMTKQSPHTRYELELNVIEGSDGALNINFLYSTDLYDRDTISLFMSYYLQILESVLQNPSVIINHITLGSVR